MLQKRNSMQSQGNSSFLTALQICNTMQFTGKCAVVMSLQKCNTMHLGSVNCMCVLGRQKYRFTKCIRPTMQ